MLRLVLFFLAVAAAAVGLSWLADRPGSMVVTWQGYEIETSVFRAIILLVGLMGMSVIGWSVLRIIWQSPAAVGAYFNRRRQKRGLEALSSGLIAIGAGDRGLAMRYAVQARKSLPNEPLTHVLRAQAAQLSGDRATARRVFEAMLGTPDTEQLGLRGLFLEAEREGAREAARQFAERAMNLNPKLGWPVHALFDIQCKNGDWAGSLETLAIGQRHNLIDRTRAERRRAVLLAAQAQAAEETDPERALRLAVDAHASAPDLVPAAAIAGRLLAARGKTWRAAKILERAWKRSPHPDLAVAYAYARPGDSPRDRLARVKRLASFNPHSIESPIAVATAAIESRDWETARRALQPLLDGRLTQRVCTLMARIEGEQHADKGRVREWLARAVNAPRDPAWTADGVVSDHWAPVSPVTGALDAFQWRVPVEALEKPDPQLVTQKLEELVPLGARPAAAIEAPGQAQPAAAATEAPRREAPPAPADIVDVAPKQPAASRETTPSAPDPQLAAATPPVSATPFKTAVVDVGPMRLPANGQASVAAVPAPPDIPAGDAGASAVAPTVPATNAQPPSAGTARVVAATKDSQRRPVTRVSEVLSRSAAPGILLAPHSPDDPGPKKNEDADADPAEQINTPVVSYPDTRKGSA